MQSDAVVALMGKLGGAVLDLPPLRFDHARAARHTAITLPLASQSLNESILFIESKGVSMDLIEFRFRVSTVHSTYAYLAKYFRSET